MKKLIFILLFLKFFVSHVKSEIPATMEDLLLDTPFRFSREIMSVQEQSTLTKLNQVALMKKFTGSWKCDLGKDTLLTVENKPFGNGMVSSSQTTVNGKNLDSVKQLYGYDKKIDRFIIAEQIKSSSVIEICNAWFTSETEGEIVIINPENVPLRFTFEFRTSDLIVQRAILNNKVVKEIALIRLKNNERE
jgi:hypothetical protein